MRGCAIVFDIEPIGVSRFGDAAGVTRGCGVCVCGCVCGGGAEVQAARRRTTKVMRFMTFLGARTSRPQRSGVSPGRHLGRRSRRPTTAGGTPALLQKENPRGVVPRGL